MPDAATEEEVTQRNRRTIFLVLGGTVSLLLPGVAALVYYVFLRPSEASFEAKGSAFARRIEGKVVPAAANAAPLTGRMGAAQAGAVSPAPISEAVPVAPTGSLGFITGGEDYKAGAGAPPPPATGAMADATAMGGQMQAGPASVAGPPAPAPPQAAAAPAAAKAPAGKAPLKAFNAPRLQPTQGFTSMGRYAGGGNSSAASGGGQAMGGMAGRGAPAGGPAAGGMPAGGGMPQMPAGMAGKGGMPQMPAGMPQMPAGMPQMPAGMAGGAGATPGKTASAASKDQANGVIGGMVQQSGIGNQLGGIQGTIDNLPADAKAKVSQKMGGSTDISGLLNGIPGMGGDKKK